RTSATRTTFPSSKIPTGTTKTACSRESRAYGRRCGRGGAPEASRDEREEEEQEGQGRQELPLRRAGAGEGQNGEGRGGARRGQGPARPAKEAGAPRLRRVEPATDEAAAGRSGGGPPRVSSLDERRRPARGEAGSRRPLAGAAVDGARADARQGRAERG